MQTVTVLVHDAEEGGFWAEVPEFPGCGSQGETLDELERNVLEAIEAWLAASQEDRANGPADRVRRWELQVPTNA
jgi:predicted RNase H-like HicB family nuclease